MLCARMASGCSRRMAEIRTAPLALRSADAIVMASRWLTNWSAGTLRVLSSTFMRRRMQLAAVVVSTTVGMPGAKHVVWMAGYPFREGCVAMGVLHHVPS